MEKIFSVYGPFDIPVTKENSARCIRTNNIKQFWDAVDQAEDNLGNSYGCYVFMQNSGRKSMPWYVGKTTNSFKKEAFTDNKRNKYHDALARTQKSKPQMFFIVQEYGYKSDKNAIDELETYLIRAAYKVNNSLINMRKTDYKWRIRGVMNCTRGEHCDASAAFNAALKLE